MLALGAFLFRNEIAKVPGLVSSFFSIKAISIKGLKSISNKEIVASSGLKCNDKIFKFSPEEVARKILADRRVKSVIVRRDLPSIYDIRVEERVPIAYWKNNENLFFVDDEGVSFPTDTKKKNPKLPMIAGDNAPKAVGELMRVLNKFPKFKSQVVFCNFIGNRRWNIQMDNEILIKLPEDNLYRAISYLSKLMSGTKQLNPNLSVIDLRIEEKIIIQEKNKENLINKKEVNKI